MGSAVYRDDMRYNSENVDKKDYIVGIPINNIMAKKLIDLIAEEYLRSFKQKLSADSTIAHMDPEGGKTINLATKKNKKWVSNTGLAPRKTAMLTFAQLKKSRLLEESLEQNKNVLDFYSWQDLDLLCGNQATPDKNLHAKIDRTVTTLGKCVLATQLVSPSTTQEEIAKKQEITKVLCEDAELKDNLGEALSQIKKGEDKRTSLWGKSSPLEHEIYNEELQNEFYSLGLGNSTKKLVLWKPSPTSASKLQWGKRISDLFSVYLNVLGFSCLLLAFVWGLIALGLITPVFIIGAALLLFGTACYIQISRYYRVKKAIISFLAEHMVNFTNLLKVDT